MYYAKENYIDDYLEDMTSTFGIVNMEERETDKEFDRSRFLHCNCIIEYAGPYFEIVVFIELDVVIL